MKPLAVVPSYARSQKDLGLLQACLSSLNATSDCDVLVVDDASPMGDETREVSRANDCKYSRSTENGGFSKTVNVGLRMARDEGRDAVLVNSDVEFMADTDWLPALQEVDAYVVGALLLYPVTKLVQSAGSYYSPLLRGWFHRYQFAPMDLKEIWEPKVCPCTAALQLIRHECLEKVGLYDEEYELAFEDVEYALRVFKSGRECVYTPYAMAFHHESMTRGDGHKGQQEMRSLERLINTHSTEEFLRFSAPPW